MRSVLANPEIVDGYRLRLGSALERLSDDTLAPISNELGKPRVMGGHEVGPVAILMTAVWLRDATDAVLQIRVAEALFRGTPKGVIVEALGLASAGNFKRQFPEVDRILNAIRASNHTNSEQSVTVRGYQFTVGPYWGPDNS